MNNKDQEILRVLKILLENEEYIRKEATLVVKHGNIYEHCIFACGLEIYFYNSICAIIWESIGYDYDINKDYFRSWSKFSGSDTYPVPIGGSYEEMENYWIGEQADLRFDLIKHLIKCYEGDI